MMRMTEWCNGRGLLLSQVCEREDKRERKEEVTGAKEHQAPTGIFIFLFLILLV